MRSLVSLGVSVVAGWLLAGAGCHESAVMRAPGVSEQRLRADSHPRGIRTDRSSAATASTTSPSHHSESVQASPRYHEAEERFARGDTRGALTLIDALLSQSRLTDADRDFLKDQRAICLKAIAGKSTPTASNSEPRTHPSDPTDQPKVTATRASRATDCGPKALLYVCRHYRIPATLREVRELCLTPTDDGSIAPAPRAGNRQSKIQNPQQGTTFQQLARAARARGLAAEGLKVDWNYLNRMPKPVIAWVRSNHYVVVLQTRWGRVHYYDPATDGIRNPKSAIRNGEGVMTSREFGEIWQGYVLTLRPR